MRRGRGLNPSPKQICDGGRFWGLRPFIFKNLKIFFKYFFLWVFYSLELKTLNFIINCGIVM